MSALLRPRPLTVEEYLEAEEAATFRHEYVNGEVYAMAGASWNHAAIVTQLLLRLGAHVGKGPCAVFANDLRLEIKHDLLECYYYPDLLVTCDPREERTTKVRFPKVVAEVLSLSTSRTDLQEKFQNYRTIPTLEEYLVVWQDRRQAAVYRRADGWVPDYAAGAGAVVELRSLGLAIPLDELYARTDVPAEA